MTHGLTTTYLKYWNKLLFAHRLNIKDSSVETKTILDACTIPTPYLIIDESVVNQTKCSHVVVTTAPPLTMWTFCLALSAIVQMLLAGSCKSCADLTKSTSCARLEERLQYQRPFDMLLLPVKGD